MKLLAYTTIGLWASSSLIVFGGGFLLMWRSDCRLTRACRMTKADERWLASFLENNRSGQV